MTVNSMTAALFTWHALKLTWQQRILTTNQILCFPPIERRSHSTQQKLFSFHITNEIFGLSAVKNTPSLVRLGHLGVKRLIFARLVDISSLPERRVAWSRLQRRTMDSLSPTQRIALQHHNSSQGTITIQCKYTWKITFALEEHCKYWCRQDRQNRKSAFRAERSYMYTLSEW